MLNKIIKFSLDNRLTIIIGALLLLVGGIYTAKNMEVDVFPDLNAPTVTVMTEAGGLAAEEVERLVTFPVETAVNGASGVRRVRSSSTTGFSIVWVEFGWDVDVYRARQIVTEKLSGISELLPSAASQPVLGPQSSILGEVMIIAFTSDSLSMLDLRTVADYTIRPRLLSIGGVSQVAVLGGDVKEFQILLSPEKMKYHDVTLSQVMEKIRGINDNASGGTLYQYGNEYIIRGDIYTTSVDDISNTVVSSDNGKHLHLSDIADVKIGAKTPKTGIASLCGKSAVLITVTKQPEAGTIELTDKIDNTLYKIEKQLPADINISTDVFRQARFIESSINNIQKSLYEGGIFVALILFLFLTNIRTTVISVITIPLALIVSIFTLKFMGLTINTMSIGGMAIAIGSLVDDAIVDVENVYKRLSQNLALAHSQQQPAIKVIYEASKEVRLPILNSTFIIVVSFLPLFFLSGIEGRMLAPLGISFIVALFASTLIALTLTPVLCSYLLSNNKSGKVGSGSFVSRYIEVWYSKALIWSLKRKKIIIVFTSILTLLTLITAFTLGRSFLPPFNEGSFTINVSTLPGISLEESDKIGRLAEDILLTVPEIKVVARKTGRAELDEHALGINTSEIEAPFELADRRRGEVLKDIREKLSVIPGVNIEIGQPISHRIDAMLSGTRAGIAIKVFGTDLNTMFSTGNKIKDVVSEVPGIVDVNVEQQIERPQLRIKPHREMMAVYGITPRILAEHINVLLGGETISQVYEGNKTFDITVKLSDENRNSIDKIRNMTIDSSIGKIPLFYVADVVSSVGPSTINREDAERKIVVSANITGSDMRGGVEEIKRRIEKDVDLPEDVHIEYSGQFESEEAASERLAIFSIFSLLIIFLLLYNQFRSISQAGVILLNLPLALIGGIFTLRFTDGIISIPAIIGFVSLFGIATRNGMLLVDRYNRLRKDGNNLYYTVIKGSIDRLNPIIMTALTSMLALIPLAIGGDMPGNEIQSPMAKVILGGLLTSTMLNIFIIPIVYTLNQNHKKKSENR